MLNIGNLKYLLKRVEAEKWYRQKDAQIFYFCLLHVSSAKRSFPFSRVPMETLMLKFYVGH